MASSNDAYSLNPNDLEMKDKEDGIIHQIFDSDQVQFSRYQKFQLIARQATEHLVVKLIIIVLIIIDCIISIISTINTSDNFDIVSLIFSIIFALEVSLRILGLGYRTFLNNWVNIADLVVVTATLIVSVAIVATTSSNIKGIRFVVVLRLLRLPRLLNILRIFLSRDHLINSTRYVTSENKRRFRMDGYDLDLCFITNRVIAMSFPSSGFTALYRNAIGDVAQFLNGRHGTNYRIYNLCDEKTYPTDLFTGEVVHFPIVDHNVPALYRMTQFARESREYLRANPEHILVVHCRGGKGRTGSMICLHLIDVGVFQSAAECLNYFGMRRTDLSLSSKFQGVDTPSQSRYVEYFGSIVDQYEREMPPSPEIYLESLTINNLPAKYLDEKFQLCCEVWSYREEQLTEMIMIGSFKWTNQQTQTTSETPSSIVIGPSENQTLAMKGDVKIKFTSNKLPKGYDHCSFFFWFHTFWIKDNKLHLDRDVIDNPHKKKFWKYYPPEFSIDICFSQ